MIVKRTAGTLLSIGVSLVLVVVAWLAFIEYFDMNPMVVRGPSDVWAYLFTAETAADNRALVWGDLTITLVDAGFGLVAGLVAAAVIAMAFVLSTAAEQAFMPVAMIMRSVPLVAMTPVLTLVFGRELLATTIIVGIVVFFPALVNIVLGLRSASPQAVDLVAAYGGSTWTALRKVLIPSALPAFFTSARISAPGAIIGAMLAEWLATGKGIGYRMLQDVSTFESDNLWTCVVVITLASLVIYSLISVVENIVLARFGRTA
ncbi:ABC transporter permease subunit [Actinocorallia sp. API 0066]|uniref:ABC transporter permease n=1 Tax=Actinocorallia sp. API 0066 TaxID=2896846 RepID=UPI001E315658|nr:ABC transporter permease subunit [Actinocorallia sp. API 0066]MCD0451518.1 ABC transporter permease subunit [Actinocorallia sp. API 0066]